MRILLLTAIALSILLPTQLSADILKDYTGRWKYVESWTGDYTGNVTLTVTVTKSRKGDYTSIGLEKVGSKQKLSYKEILRANRTALLEHYDSDGKLISRYTGTWSIKRGKLHYAYQTEPDSSGRVAQITGWSQREGPRKWTGKASYKYAEYGTNKSTYTMTRLR